MKYIKFQDKKWEFFSIEKSGELQRFIYTSGRRKRIKIRDHPFSGRRQQTGSESFSAGTGKH